jgi:hypothetical protein
MAKTKRRRPSQRSKRRPPSQQAPPRLGSPYEPAATRTFVAPSRQAKRARVIRTSAAVGAAVGLLFVALFLVNRGGGGGELRTTTLSGKVLAPTVSSRSTATADPLEFATGDRLIEGSIIETDATGLGEFEYADGSVVRVGPSSNYTLTKSRTEGDRRDIAGKLTTGRSWHRVTPRSGDDADYKVEVLGATGEVRGTSYAVVCPVETNCFYTVVKGKVHVVDAVRQEADLVAGDQVEVKFGRIEPVKHLTPEEIGADPWLAQNITLDGDTPPDPGETTTTIEGETTTTIEGETTTTIPGQPPATRRTGTATTRGSSGGGGGGPQPTTGTTQAPTNTTVAPATTAPPTTAAPTTRTTRCRNQADPKCSGTNSSTASSTTTPPTTTAPTTPPTTAAP